MRGFFQCGLGGTAVAGGGGGVGVGSGPGGGGQHGAGGELGLNQRSVFRPGLGPQSLGQSYQPLERDDKPPFFDPAAERKRLEEVSI